MVSEEWIDAMLSVQSDVPAHKELDFGYFWWQNNSNGYKFMWGHGGQYVFLIPEKNAMVVITSIEQLADEIGIFYDDATDIVDKIKATLK